MTNSSSIVLLPLLANKPSVPPAMMRAIVLLDAMSKLRALRGVNFYWRREEFPSKNFEATEQVGFIAQDVEAVMPEVVRTNGEGLKAVQYSGVIPYVVEAQKQHDDAIRQLEEKVTALQQKNAEQSQLIAVQSQQIAALLSHLPTAQTH